LLSFGENRVFCILATDRRTDDSIDALSRSRCRERQLNKADRIIILHPAMWHDHDIDFARRLLTATCSVACGCGIMTVNSPSGSSLQCDTWL